MLFRNPEASYHLREVVRLTGVGQGSVQRELANLVEAELITRTRRGSQVFFQANQASPVFAEVAGLVRKTCGVAAPIEKVLVGLGDGVEVAFLFGSIPAGTADASSDVDVLVVGDAPYRAVVEALAEAEPLVGRPISPTVYRRAEFIDKLRSKNHFLTQVMKSEKEVVIGDLEDLAAMV